MKDREERIELTGSQQLLAGAVSGTVNRMFIAPLDLLKVRFQIQSISTAHHHFYTSLFDATRTIIREEGMWAFWKGNVSAPAVVTMMLSFKL